MGGFFRELWPFGDKDDEPKVPDKVEPDVTPIPVPIDPHQPPDEIEIQPDEDPGDIVGDPVLARTVDPSKSDHRILPEGKLHAPGDRITLTAKIVNMHGEPVAGLPVIWVIKATAKRIGGPVVTDSNGVAADTYTVGPGDMSGDMSDDVPDSGSYLVNCYAGGRLLNKVTILHDVV